MFDRLAVMHRLAMIDGLAMRDRLAMLHRGAMLYRRGTLRLAVSNAHLNIPPNLYVPANY
jgi:hypothetical protein